MRNPKRTLCSSLLLVAPWLPAQSSTDPAPQRSDERTIRIDGGAIVRNYSAGPAVKSELSRDGGKTWAGLRDIDWRMSTPWSTFDPLAGEPPVPTEFPTPGDNQLKIVQFWSQILPEYRETLDRMRVEIHNYLPEQGYLVRIDAQQQAALAALPWVRWIGDWKLAYRIDRAVGEDLLAKKELPSTRYNVVLFDRLHDRGALVALIEATGGKVAVLGDHKGAENCLVEANLTGAQMLRVAASNLVTWVERWSAPEVDMDNVRIVSGANYIEAKGGYKGRGVRGHIMEGIYATHQEYVAVPPYRGAPIGLWNTSADQHGNATFGEVFANGFVAQARGMCPEGQGLFTNSAYISGTGTGTGTRYYVYQQLTDPLQSYKAMQQTASWGDTQNITYNATSVAMDLGIFTFDVPTTQSQSNTGSQSSRPQAWAKNIISIGGHYHYDNANFNDDRWGNGGSTGPAPDGRIKPDLCAYYDLIYTTYSTSTTGYGQFSGTSSATPMCNGMLGLAQEMYTDGLFGHALPQPAVWQNRFANRAHFTTMKALLINTARQYDATINTGSNRYNAGWGFPQLNTIYDERDRLLLLNEDDTLQLGQTRSYFVWAPGGKTLRTTMVFSDPPGTASVNPNRVNDLSLKVTDANGTFWWGNNGLLGTSLYSTSGGVANTLDTVENVFIKSAPMGWYRIDVSASLIAQDQHKETPALDADFALSVNGIGGLRDTTGTKLALSSGSPGDFQVAVSGLPASYVEGYTVFSMTTTRPVSFGNFFGVEFDGLALGSFNFPASAGNVFHFTPTAAAVYPNAPFVFDSSIASAMTGVTFDAVAFTLDANGAVNSMSNVARVKLQ